MVFGPLMDKIDVVLQRVELVALRQSPSAFANLDPYHHECTSVAYNSVFYHLHKPIYVFTDDRYLETEQKARKKVVYNSCSCAEPPRKKLIYAASVGARVSRIRSIMTFL